MDKAEWVICWHKEQIKYITINGNKFELLPINIYADKNGNYTLEDGTYIIKSMGVNYTLVYKDYGCNTNWMREVSKYYGSFTDDSKRFLSKVTGLGIVNPIY